MKKYMTLLILILSFHSFAQNLKENFSVVVEGSRAQIDFIKVRSELTMARSTKFCRGSKMPRPIGEWNCSNTAPRVSHCVSEYKCQFINKKFNRITETRRLRNRLKGMSRVRPKYTVSVIYKDKKEVLKEITGSTRKAKTYKVAPTTTFASQRLVSSKKQQTKRKVSKNINRPQQRKSAPIRKVETRPQPSKKKGIADESDLDELSFLLGDDEQEESTEVTEIDEEVVSEEFVEKNEIAALDNTEKEKPKSNLRFEFANISVNYISMSDNEENSISTMGLSWTPHLWFNENMGVRGELGFHSYSTIETDTVASETFSVYKMSIFGVYQFTNIFVELGYGIEKWNGELAESSSFISYGAGYRFDTKKLYVIDRVSLGMSSLSNIVATKELVFTIGASF